MAYLGISGQFDGGLTNPSRNPMRGRFNFGNLPGVGGKPDGTKPMPISQPAPGGGAPGAPSSPSYGGPRQPTDEYWPWPTAGTPTPAAPKAGEYDPNPLSYVNSTGDGKAAGHVWDKDDPTGPFSNGVAAYGEAPPIPTGRATAGPISGAAAGKYYGYTPEKWAPSEMDIPEAGVNTREIVAALKPRLEEEMAAGMGNAARRFGALGGLKGTGYATTLGASERKMFEDLNALNYKYDYDAAQSDANRKSTARENALNRELSGYGTYTGAMGDEASRHTNYGLTQQQIANDLSKTNANLQNTGVQINNKQDWDKYFAGLSEAQRKQMYDQMMLDYGG